MAQAAPQAGQSESMEEILQSIKRIIEDDTVAEAKPAAAPVEEDVLDLTQAQVVGEPAPAPSSPTPPAPAEDVMKSIDAMFAEKPEPTPTPAPKAAQPPAQPIPTPQPPKPVIMEDGLVSDQAAQAAAAALKPIAETANKDFSIPQFPSANLRGGNTVEDLILEALRPMLKDWLDEHLPTIVQKIVEKEVKRIVAFHQD